MLIALIGIPTISLGAVVMLPGLENQDLVAPMMILETLPSWIAGFLLAGVVAAIMSTADSQLLVAGSAFGEDLYNGIIKRDATDREILLANRAAVIGIGIFAGIWAYLTPESVHATILFAWAGLGAGLGPALLMPVYWKKTTGLSVVAGMVTGIVVTVVWNQLSGGPFMIFDMYELLPSFSLALLVIIVVSIFTGPPKRREELIKRELNEITKPLQEEIDLAQQNQDPTKLSSQIMKSDQLVATTNEEIVAVYLSKTQLSDLSTVE